MASIKVNRNAVLNAISKHFDIEDKFITPIVRNTANRKFREIYKEILKRFDEHDVTKEILAGARASSKFVAPGNLYSFLGFDSSEPNPIEDLRATLADGIVLNQTPTYYGKLKRYYFKIYYPTYAEILSETADRLPWDGRSWIYFVEGGIDNLNHYLFSRNRDFPQSYSGPALQTKAVVPTMAGKTFNGVDYVSEIIKFIEKQV